MDFVVVVLPLVVDAASLVASVCLFRWVSRRKGHVARKLLTRQLWHLALADIFHAVIISPWFVLAFVGCMVEFPQDALTTLDALCVFSLWNNTMFMASLLLEVQMALATVFAIYRNRRALRVLSFVLPLAWPVGFILGSGVAIRNQGYWDSGLHVCNTHGENGSLQKAGTILLALCICIFSYVASGCRACRSTAGSVQRRIWTKTKFFLAAALVCWGPLMVFTYSNFMDPGHMILNPDNSFQFYLVFSFYLSNGLLNAAVYAWRTKGAVAANATSLPGNETERSRNGSLVVAFDVDPQVVPVSRVSRAALRRAERETEELQFEREREADKELDTEAGGREAGELGECDDNPCNEADDVERDLLGCFDVDVPSSSTDSYLLPRLYSSFVAGRARQNEFAVDLVSLS